MDTAFVSGAEQIGGDSLRKRYLYKLGFSVVGFPLGLFTQSITARLLGPAALGDYGFLTNFFSQLIAFFDSGLSAGFYSKLSQRQSESSLVRFFWGLLGLLSCLILLAVAAAFVLQIQGWLWPNQEVDFVWMAMIWGIATWYSQTANRVLDAYGLTVQSEAARFLQRAFATVLLGLMFWVHWSGLRSFFLYQYFILALLISVWWIVLRKSGRALLPKAQLSSSDLRNYGKEFYTYSLPLLGLAFVGLITGLLDRWLLQTFSGSVEQGFYSFSYQIGAICFLLVGAMTPLFWRDFAKAVGESDLVRMRALFSRVVPVMYCVASFFSVFVAVQSANVSLLWGGNEFEQAALSVAMMALYPIHQTYGQLTSTVFFSTGQTRTYRNVGVGVAIVGLGLTYWLLAPAAAWGLNLGAPGLALKMVFIQVVSVNILLWFVTRYLQLSFTKFIRHQFCVVISLAVVAWLSSALVSEVTANTLLAFVLSGVSYTVACVAMLFLFPSFVSMTSSEIRGQVSVAWKQLKGVLGGI